MTDVNPKIFKKYDIRGKADGDDAVITKEVARLIGRTFASYAQRVDEKTTIGVGRDNRNSSYMLAEAAMLGAKESGCKVIDLGLVLAVHE